MKKTRFLFLLAIGLLPAIPPARADHLDDMIGALRVGAKFDPSQLGTNLLTAMSAQSGSSSQAFSDAEANLYLYEIKLSIIDPESEGGWPYRSFLIQSDLNLRKMLTDALTARFAATPDPLLAYASICPALYAKDEKQVASLESYLKDKDPFLYKLEQGQVAQFWRSNIESVLKQQGSGN
jgi:hypothetical protein